MITNTTNTTIQTLGAALEQYYQCNPHFIRNQDLWVGWIRVPWMDLQRHDIMHIITGYGTELDDELRLIGFLLTALTGRRPWYYYVQTVGVFLELLGRSLTGRQFRGCYLTPNQVCRYYWQGICQGRRIRKPINAFIDPATVMDCPVTTLRNDYGIRNAGAWDSENGSVGKPKAL